MERSRFDEYIRRFNQQDQTAFDDFIAADMRMLNGGLVLDGREAMRNHYAAIWSGFTETLEVQRFVSDSETVAVQMWAHFEATRDDAASVFGPVAQGETFDFRGLIMYQLGGGMFADCKVAYNSFVRTVADGSRTELGMPH